MKLPLRLLIQDISSQVVTPRSPNFWPLIQTGAASQGGLKLQLHISLRSRLEVFALILSSGWNAGSIPRPSFRTNAHSQSAEPGPRPAAHYHLDGVSKSRLSRLLDDLFTSLASGSQLQIDFTSCRHHRSPQNHFDLLEQCLTDDRFILCALPFLLESKCTSKTDVSFMLSLADVMSILSAPTAGNRGITIIEVSNVSEAYSQQLLALNEDTPPFLSFARKYKASLFTRDGPLDRYSILVRVE